jgi:hypothetical protein
MASLTSVCLCIMELSAGYVSDGEEYDEGYDYPDSNLNK